VPADHPLAAGDLGAIFTRVGAAWAGALADLGVSDLSVHDGAGTARRRGNPRERLLAAVCYATLGRGEVVAGGRKVVGLAQRRRRPGALVQCGLLRRWEPRALLRALGADPEDPEIVGAAVGLDDLVDDPPDDAAVMEAVRRRLAGEVVG
jgi:lipoate---protein ligase